jgi:hypothetical protein
LTDLIRVEWGAEVRPGVFAWKALGLSGESRQPLLDACRRIKPLDVRNTINSLM